MESSANIPQPENFILRAGQHKDIWGIIHLFYFDHPQILVWLASLVFAIICLTLISIFLSFITDITIITSVFITIISIILFLVLIIVLDGFALFNFSTDKFLVFEYNRKIIACVSYRTLANYSKISRLHVHSKYRRQGLGSRLVKAVIRNVKKPIYLISVPKALYFYIKLKFIPIPRHRLPKFYSVSSRKGRIVLGYIDE
ncbi:GCN5-related N-acetyltransferase [Nostoc sp. NIES-2111]|nr:GCN5-related N-acetyltransferase [Nostoc sp. NIES-2111]